MVLTTRLSLHKPASGSENFGDYFPTQYAADLQKIDDMMQIKLIAAAGKIPVYDQYGFLVSSGIVPEDLQVGLLNSILTTQGMLLYRNATQLAALSPDAAGKSLLTQGAGANPLFGFPNHNTLVNLGVGDYHPQYVLRSLLSSRGAIPYMGATDWVALSKGAQGQVIVQGADDPAWATRNYHLEFPFGDGSSVLIANGKYLLEAPITGTIVQARCLSGDNTTGSIQFGVWKKAYASGIPQVGDSVATYSITSDVKSEYTSLNVAVTQGDLIVVNINNVTGLKTATLSLRIQIS
jgi:hypothetical protein